MVCGHILFKSDTKYDSGCGWPAFFDTAGPGIVRKIQDYTHGMSRIEVTCANVSTSCIIFIRMINKLHTCWYSFLKFASPVKTSHP